MQSASAASVTSGSAWARKGCASTAPGFEYRRSVEAAKCAWFTSSTSSGSESPRIAPAERPSASSQSAAGRVMPPPIQSGSKTGPTKVRPRRGTLALPSRRGADAERAQELVGERDAAALREPHLLARGLEVATPVVEACELRVRDGRHRPERERRLVGADRRSEALRLRERAPERQEGAEVARLDLGQAARLRDPALRVAPRELALRHDERIDEQRRRAPAAPERVREAEGERCAERRHADREDAPIRDPHRDPHARRSRADHTTPSPR